MILKQFQCEAQGPINEGNQDIHRHVVILTTPIILAFWKMSGTVIIAANEEL